jgi:adenylate cyclase
VSLRKLFEELKRRHVMRVTGLYLVGAWIIIQVAATVFPLLGWPDSATKVVLIIAGLGLPVVVLLAWVFDITPEGIQRTSDAAVATVAGASTAQLEIEAHRRRFAARSMGFVGVGILVALVGFAAFQNYSGISGNTGTEIKSIAVLPFSDLSPQHDQEYFTDGLAEEILNQLAQVEGLSVAGRTSSFAFKGKNVGSTEIGRQLRVQAVLEGSVRREDDRVRVTARLVNTETSATIWQDQYDLKIASTLALQDTISTAIVDKLKIRLTSTPEVAGAGTTTNAEAKDLYFKGLQALNQRTQAQLEIALQYFEQAADADTSYALAYSGLAKTYAVLPSVSDFPASDALRKGTESAARALALHPQLGEAYAALGQLAQNLEWDLTSALRNYNRALKFSKNDAVAHQWYSEALMLTGDLKTAEIEIERALEIDPLSPAARSVRAYQMMLRGDLPGAVRAYQILLRESPDFRVAQLNYAFAALAAKDYSSAAEGLISSLPRHAPNVATLIAAASGQGDRQAAVNAIKAMEIDQPVSVVALMYAAVGAKQQAVAALEKGFAASQDANFPYVLVHPLLKPLQSDPKFQQIARSVGVTLL